MLYLTLDFPRSPNTKAIANNHEIRLIAQELNERYPGRVKYHFRDANVGCAASILSSIDWFFQSETEGVILEDDCIPSRDFYTFSEDALTYLKQDSDVLLSCGTQTAPLEITQGIGFKSSYILTWGWATTATNWNEIKRILTGPKRNSFTSCFSANIERQYWKEGSRRAQEGFVDVWDTVLVNALQLNSKFAILPGINLVTNIGADSVATHTLESPWTNQATRLLANRQLNFSNNEKADFWLKKCNFGISARHLISTRLTLLKDRIFANKIFDDDLITRWQRASIDSLI